MYFPGFFANVKNQRPAVSGARLTVLSIRLWRRFFALL